MKKFILILLIAICNNVKADTTGVYQMIVSHDIKCPKIVYAQLMYESGYLNCNDCSWSSSNNAFGFHNGKRYLRYKSLDHCIENYKEWQVWRGFDGCSEYAYYDFLNDVWGAPNMTQYIEKLKQIYKLIFE